MTEPVDRNTVGRVVYRLLGVALAVPLVMSADMGLASQSEDSHEKSSKPQPAEDGCTYQVEYYPSGSIKSKVGFATGDGGQAALGCTTTVYYENGHVAMEQAFRDGIPHGMYRTYYENGKAEMEYTYDYGTPNGTVTYWYPSGKLKAKGTMKEGLKDGHWTTWHEDGSVESDGDYADDRKIGVWTYHKADGSTTKIIDYSSATETQ